MGILKGIKWRSKKVATPRLKYAFLQTYYKRLHLCDQDI
jgi:hypothetical protein